MHRWVRRVLADERGFTIIEAVVGLSLLAVASAGFATTVGQGLGLVGSSNERQTAVQVANQVMENTRSYTYDALSHSSTSVFTDGTGTPDTLVSGSAFTGISPSEQLVIDSESTLLRKGTETVRAIEFSWYRYVTWVDDGAGDAQAYKRVTVIIDWSGTDSADERVTLTSLFTGDGVAWSTTTSTSSTSTTSSTTSTSSTTTTTTGPCPGDGTAPTGSISILAGTGANSGYTSSTTVSLSLSASDACTPITMAFSTDGSSWGAYQAYATSASQSIPSGDGQKTVYVRYRDNAGNLSQASGTIRLDQSNPTTPGSFTATKASSGRRVNLSWARSTDNDTLIGYRVYRKVGTGSYSLLYTSTCSSATCTYTDPPSGNLTNDRTYTYYVVSYDAAGNTSAATVERAISFP